MVLTPLEEWEAVFCEYSVRCGHRFLLKTFSIRVQCHLRTGKKYCISEQVVGRPTIEINS